MTVAKDRAAAARRMAADALRRGDPNGWFEELYASAGRGDAWVPWAEFAPNCHLVSWAGRRQPQADGKRAMVVGCGLGDDAEFLACLGFEVTAFDVAPTAVTTARSRFPGSAVDYTVADVLSPPSHWNGRYDLVVEAYTVQVHRAVARTTAIREIAGFVAPAGTLLAIARARDERDELGAMPWPLTMAEVISFASGDLRLSQVEEVAHGDPPVRHWRAEFRRPAATSGRH